MQSTAARKVAGLLALALTLALPSSALAASTASTTSESLTVTATISLSGVPASLAYADAVAGAMASAPEFTAAVASNNASGWTLTVNGSALTSGANSIAATNREYVMSGTGYTATGGGSPVAYPGGDFAIATKGTGGSANVFITSRIHVPANAAPGAYTGTATFTASTNP